MINGSQSVSPITEDENEESSGQEDLDDAMSESDDGKSLEEPLFDEGEDVSEPSDQGDWLDRLEQSPEYEDGDDLLFPEPPPVAGERPARRRQAQRGRPERARPVARPVQMTKTQWMFHRAQGHVRYHPGCKHCVMAKAIADRHQRAIDDSKADDEDDPDEPPVIGADFCFPGDKGEEDPLTVIVMCGSRTKGMFAHSCPGREIVSGEHSELSLIHI